MTKHNTTAPTVDQLLQRTLVLLDNTLSHLEKQPAHGRDINALGKITNALLSIKRQQTVELHAVDELDDDELDRRLLEEAKKLQDKGYDIK